MITFSAPGNETLVELTARINERESGGLLFVENTIVPNKPAAPNAFAFRDAGLSYPNHPLLLTEKEIPKGYRGYVWDGPMLVSGKTAHVWAYRDLS
jgi:hypothetical protein